MKKFLSTTLAIIVSMLVLTGISTQAAEKSLTMATTTSTDNTGLLDYLMPHFTKETGIEIKWTATGTGKALKLGSKCDVDVLLVHAPGAEKKFIDQGFGKDRKEIMYNDFVIIGPKDDPAGVKGKSVARALDTIRDANAAFASRGDDSGTNKKEKILWKQTGKALPEKETWYIQTGQGMLATINVCEERKAYTMTDRGTYIKYQSQKGGDAPLVVLVEGDDILLNQYSVLTLNPGNCPNAKYDLAMAFSDWMAGKSAQTFIKNFRLLDKKLFIPNAK
ncbi:tungstate transport system substrate-binding protein [Desulfocicer vacuolatum DSM 3385]|uniref:Tungstate transport system substrate-binding protein n=2 Tax=Desulfocicer vacuolatum TaxID=2298 RepID=A0A1W2BEN2_9BACT|nr:substrate-binding domain-containing protein [Desulfocicer vacuolatum]SMC71455.1 tungstate transport system substrate-binding protein [Desulfocicer vacuolatum DSM 3385]